MLIVSPDSLYIPGWPWWTSCSLLLSCYITNIVTTQMMGNIKEAKPIETDL